MRKFAVIVAGGTGTRMKTSIPKQLLLLDGKPVLYYSIKAFLDAYEDCSVILVLPEEHTAAGQEIIDAFFDYSRVHITVGGRTRFHSVQNGLKLVDEDSVVFVHDAVRCLLTTALIRRCYDSVIQFGSAIPVVAINDSIRMVAENGNEAVDRSLLRAVQTPQAFYSKILLPAFNIDYKDHFTDEATVVEAFGLRMNLVDGEETNIKITRPIDLELASAILNKIGQTAGEQG